MPITPQERDLGHWYVQTALRVVLGKFSKEDLFAITPEMMETIATLCYDMAVKLILEDRER